MADAYTPWRRQQSYPDMNDPNALEEVAKQRMRGVLRQREGSFPSFYSKLMELFGRGSQQPQPPTYRY